jgi:hypothetical protein
MVWAVPVIIRHHHSLSPAGAVINHLEQDFTSLDSDLRVREQAKVVMKGRWKEFSSLKRKRKKKHIKFTRMNQFWDNLMEEYERKKKKIFLS